MNATPSGFAAALLADVERACERIGAPRVRALHQPPGFTPGHKDGEFCALELDDGSIGLSFLLLEGTLDALAAERPGHAIRAMSSLELARGYASAHPLRRALGLAAINALSQRLFRLAGYTPPPAPDAIGGLEPGAGDRVGMVGWFPPLTRQIVASGAALVVLELDPAKAGEKDGFRVTLDLRELGPCTKVLSTTTLMLNDTLDSVLAACEAARRVVLIGPGGGCLPDALFARGVHALGGTGIVDRDAFVDALVRGERWGPHARKYCIEARDYPGAAALTVRANCAHR
ncbi:MAG: hypothetical protein KJZ83_15605 [Burkholderiaceae bacterium]|nr:hypothetical protein [Burkholderiaceae bacterium]